MDAYRTIEICPKCGTERFPKNFEGEKKEVFYVEYTKYYNGDGDCLKIACCNCSYEFYEKCLDSK